MCKLTEVQNQGYIFNPIVIHTGQYHPYGDSFLVIDIKTTCQNKDIVVDTIKTCICPEHKNTPVKEEWKKMSGPSNYFAGYYTIEKIDNGWRYTKCSPYTD